MMIILYVRVCGHFSRIKLEARLQAPAYSQRDPASRRWPRPRERHHAMVKAMKAMKKTMKVQWDYTKFNVEGLKEVWFHWPKRTKKTAIKAKPYVCFKDGRLGEWWRHIDKPGKWIKVKPMKTMKRRAMRAMKGRRRH